MRASGIVLVQLTLNYLILVSVFIYATFEWTNVECESLDRPFVKFETCRIKSVNRSYKYLSVRANLFELPVTDCTVNFGFYKRASGYKPFLYNLTVDACKFIKNSDGNIIVKYFFSAIEKYSNLNHTCPYNHDIIVDKVPIDHVNNLVTKVLPLPEGEYAFKMIWSAYKKPRVTVNVYFKLT